MFINKHKFILKKEQDLLKNELMLFTNFCKLNNFSANHQDIPSPEIKLQPDRHT